MIGGVVTNSFKEIPGRSNDECFTPSWIFDALSLQFDLDVAAPNISTHVPALHFFTKEQDGLNQRWFGRVWMNPPFSKPLPWIERFIEHKNGIALLPTSIGKWQLRIWNDPQSNWVMLPPVKFDGFKTALPTRCYLIGYGEECVAALRNIGTVKGAI